MVALLSLCGASASRMLVPWTRGDDKQTATHQDVFWKASLTGPTCTLGELCLLSYLL